LELKGAEGGYSKGGAGGETRRRKSLRIGVHIANAVVWGPVYRTHLLADAAAGVEHRRVVQRRAFVYVPRVRRRAAVE
jgi:hypothetical protein